MTERKLKAVRPRLEALVSQDRDLLKALVKEALDQILQAEMTDLLGAAPGERTATRVGYRAGYYERGLVTRVGKIELRIPRDRSGEFSTALFERFQRSEKALVSALVEMYVQGVSTRKVKAITEELCGHSFAASTISAINKGLGRGAYQVRPPAADRGVPVSDRGRPLREGARRRDHPEPGGADRHRHQLGGPAPGAGRGARQPGEPDQLAGLSARTQAAGSARRRAGGLRRSRRPAQGDCGGPARGGLAALLRALPAQCPGLPAAQGRRRLPAGAALAVRPAQRGRSAARPGGLASRWQRKYPKLTDWVEENIGSTLTFYRLPRQHHKHLKSTNMLERLNEELRRRTRVVRIFPNAASCMRLIRALCVETHEGWLEDHRYLNMDLLREARKDQLKKAA